MHEVTLPAASEAASGSYKTIFLFVHFFFLLRCKKKKRTKKEKHAISKETVKCFIGDFSATGCCKNHLKTQLFLIKVTTGACRPRTPLYISYSQLTPTTCRTCAFGKSVLLNKSGTGNKCMGSL